MIIRLLFGMMSLVAVVGMLWGSVTPAHGCSCAVGDDETFAKSLLEHSPIVVVGTIADAESKYTQLDVEAIYKGEVVARISLDQTQDEASLQRDSAARQGYPDLLGTGPGDCSIVLLGRPGQRYLLGLTKSDEVDGVYRDSLCATVGERPSTEYFNWDRLISSLENASGGGLTPAGLPTGGGVAGNSPFPMFAAALAVLGPLAFLVGAAFLWRPSRASG